ncbi:hypothetical protein P4S91_04530 [Aneurinibacillus aneurinilyticus]|uniref:Uncharacterized protein n=1 Tax=Aneurinibacillus aneurinilyticus ATCC 12856 TaxID=649747 RepID=U1YGB3_ANEAE|nr:hypothetical protein [Aneurinibacillus aneurinilyticus]ERI09806.1 hypothetical protein HMPREF0083_02069 [Aneurinibacillus aneurinilyticus ATCC 12856]MED0668785.1 hypothetical protein [Aneurinibacillus aneurinilyticus]MED0722197.1 hypothetical protein [Aneurinibacillus aneurinilyticus]MED0734357.1 hypothetical protein [Aneurinibacillus aneurinilyticus]MED0741861.1 hypothetical protein [Aneurinibacillus aneurinilyticus]
MLQAAMAKGIELVKTWMNEAKKYEPYDSLLHMIKGMSMSICQ